MLCSGPCMRCPHQLNAAVAVTCAGLQVAFFLRGGPLIRLLVGSTRACCHVHAAAAALPKRAILVKAGRDSRRYSFKNRFSLPSNYTAAAEGGQGFLRQAMRTWTMYKANWAVSKIVTREYPL